MDSFWLILPDSNIPSFVKRAVYKPYKNHIKTNTSKEAASLIDYHATVYASFVFTTLKWLLISGNESDIEKITQDFNSTFFDRIFFRDFKTDDIAKI
jgi:hypothetical protein